MASVAMKAGVLKVVTITPFKKLQNMATAMETIMAKGMEPIALYEITERVPAKAITEPLDKSSKPHMIKMVWPKARIVVTEICLEMLVRLPHVRKLALSIIQHRNNTTRTSRILYRLSRALNVPDLLFSMDAPPCIDRD